MKKVIPFILFIVLSMIRFGFAQTDMKDVKYLKSLDRDTLIQIAVNMLGQDIELVDYQIKVMAGKKDLYVTFDMPVKFVPLNSEYYFGAYVNLIERMTSKHALKNPKDRKENSNKVLFFKHTKTSKEHINFVLRAIEKSDKIGKGGKVVAFENDMTIFEKENYYEVTVLSVTQESSYKIEKITGRIYDEGHAHLIFDDEENKIDTYIELK